MQPIEAQPADPRIAFQEDFPRLQEVLGNRQGGTALDDAIVPAIRYAPPVVTAVAAAPMVPGSGGLGLPAYLGLVGSAGAAGRTASGLYEKWRGIGEEATIEQQLGAFGSSALMAATPAAAPGKTVLGTVAKSTVIGATGQPVIETPQFLAETGRLPTAGETLEMAGWGAAFSAGFAGLLARGLPAGTEPLFYRNLGMSKAEFKRTFPDVAKRVARGEGSPADVDLVQRVYTAAEGAGIKQGDLVRGRAAAEISEFEPRSLTPKLPKAIVPERPRSSIRFEHERTGPRFEQPLPRESGEPVAGRDTAGQGEQPLYLTDEFHGRTPDKPAPADVPPSPTKPAEPTPTAPTVTPAPVQAIPVNVPEHLAPVYKAAAALENPQGALPGAPTVVHAARGEVLPARYILLPAGSVQASHVGMEIAKNPRYPLENTRDYDSNPAEKEKLLDVRNRFDATVHITDATSASLGPSMIARIISPEGQETLAVLGGNNREWAIQNITPERRAQLEAWTAERAGRFGLPVPEPGQQLYRFLGTFDLGQPGTRERLQQLVDVLNPSPGKQQNVVELGRIDATTGLTAGDFAGMHMNVTPKFAQEWLQRLVAEGRVDRMTRSAIAESTTSAQQYLQTALLMHAYRQPPLIDARSDNRTAVASFRNIVDAGVGPAIALRAKGYDGPADAFGRTFAEVLDYLRNDDAGSKLPVALERAASQQLVDPDEAIVNDIAAALRTKVVLNPKGRVLIEETTAGAAALFADIERAIANFAPEPDMFGQADTIRDAVRRGIEFNAQRDPSAPPPPAPANVPPQAAPEPPAKPTKPEPTLEQRMTFKVDRDILIEGKWPNGKKLTAAERKKLEKGIAALRQQFPQIDKDQEPEQPWDTDTMREPSAAYGDRRAMVRREKELRALAAAGKLDAKGHAELEEIERSLGQEFFDFADAARQEEAALRARTEHERAQAEMKARMEAKLQGTDSGAQDDLFGGQLNLLEAPADPYYTRATPAPAEAVQLRAELKAIEARPLPADPRELADYFRRYEAARGRLAVYADAVARTVLDPAGARTGILRAAIAPFEDGTFSILADVAGHPIVGEWRHEALPDEQAATRAAIVLAQDRIGSLLRRMRAPDRRAPLERALVDTERELARLDGRAPRTIVPPKPPAVQRPADGFFDPPAGDNPAHDAAYAAEYATAWARAYKVRDPQRIAGARRYYEDLIANWRRRDQAAVYDEQLELALPEGSPAPVSGAGRGDRDRKPRADRKPEVRPVETGDLALGPSGPHYGALLADPAGNATELARALAEGRRISVLLEELLPPRTMVDLPISGVVIKTSHDLAQLMLAIRSPQFERFAVAITDANTGAVLAAEVHSLGSVAHANVDDIRIWRWAEAVKKRHPKRRLAIHSAHNHPSGEVDPSNADRIVWRQINDEAPARGFVAGDHLVIDGHQFYSLKEYAALPYSKAPGYRWSAVWRGTRAAGVPISSPSQTQHIANAIGQVREDRAYVAFLNRKNALMALEMMPPDLKLYVETDAELDALRMWVKDASDRNGAAAVIVMNPPGGMPSAEQFRNLHFDLKQTTIELHDIAVYGEKSAWQKYGRPGTLDFPRGGVAEPSAPYEPPVDPRDALTWSDGTDAAGHVPVRLEGLEDIKIVAMPELVQLARTLSGRIPEIKQLPESLGLFHHDKKGRISLDWRIFKDPISAAKTLAHEIGHNFDWLDEMTMKRGNVAGHLAVLRSFTKDAIPISPDDTGTLLTKKDRQRIRGEAMKNAGKRPKDPAGLAEWRKRVAELYAQAIEKQYGGRGMVRTKLLREELVNVTQYWKPFDEEAVSASYRDYRLSAPELYADMYSMLMMSPATLKRIAPKTWEVFFNYLDRKPEASAAVRELWDWLHRPILERLGQRQANILEGYVRGDEQFLEAVAARKAQYGTFRGWWDRLRQNFDDLHAPLTGRAAALKRGGVKIPQQQDPEFLFGEAPLGNNQAHVWLDHVWKNVAQPLEQAEIPLDRLGLWLQANRVRNESSAQLETRGRAELANPGGMTPLTAAQQLILMRHELGAEKAGLIEWAARQFQDDAFRAIERGVRSGLYPAADLQRYRANKYNYATFAIIDHMAGQDYIPAGIRRQFGTFKDTMDPFHATVLKMLSVHRAVQVNNAKRNAVRFLSTWFGGEIQKAAKKWDANRKGFVPIENPDRAGGNLHVWENGRHEIYYVAPEVERMFEGITPAWTEPITQVLSWSFRNIFHPLWIKYNPAFQLFLSPGRDLRRTLVNTPPRVGAQVAGEYVRQWASTFLGLPRSADARAIEQFIGRAPDAPHPQGAGAEGNLIREMLANSAIGTPYDLFRTGIAGSHDEVLEEILKKHRLLRGDPEIRHPTLDKALELARYTGIPQLLRWIEFAGITFELLPKVTTYRVLTRQMGWDPQRAAAFVRNHVGVPNIHQQGGLTRIAGAWVPFFNVFQKGYKHDLELARGRSHAAGEGTAAGWWLRWAAVDGIWTIIQALAVAGLLGATLKRYYDGVSDYDLTNYNVVPVGEVTGGEYGSKTVAIRVPRDETHRLLSGVIHHVIQQSLKIAGVGEPRGESPGAIFDVGAGQVPSIHPLLELGKGWTEYLSGRNPRDSFHGGTVVSSSKWLEHGYTAEGAEQMVYWTLQKSGASNFVQFNRNPTGWTELTVSAIPGVNRFVKITDRGHAERQEAEGAELSDARKRIRLSFDDSVQRLYSEYARLRSMREAMRTPYQVDRYRELAYWHRTIYSPAFEQVEAGSPRAAEIRRRLAELSEPYARR